MKQTKIIQQAIIEVKYEQNSSTTRQKLQKIKFKKCMCYSYILLKKYIDHISSMHVLTKLILISR